MLVRLLDRILDTALACCVLLASSAIFAQVVCRYALNQPLVWADEFAVLVFAWMTFIGAAVAQRTDSHIAIDSFTRLLPVRVRTALRFATIIATLAVLALIAWQGLLLSQRMLRIAYPAMGISRAWLYATLPVCMPLIAWYMLRGAIARLRGTTAVEITADDWNEP